MLCQSSCAVSAVSIKLCCQCCVNQAVLSALCQSSCAVSAVLSVLCQSSCAVSAVSIKLCCQCCVNQAVLSALCQSSCAVSAVSIKLFLLQLSYFADADVACFVSVALNHMLCSHCYKICCNILSFVDINIYPSGEAVFVII